MVVRVLIRPGVSPLDRGTLEEMVVDAIGGDIEILGGGTLMSKDGTVEESDFDLEVVDRREEAEIVDVVRKVLEGVSFTQATAFEIIVDE